MTVDLANSSSGTITLQFLQRSIARVSTTTTPAAAVTAGNAYAYGVYVRTKTTTNETFSGGKTVMLEAVVAKHVGPLGNKPTWKSVPVRMHTANSITDVDCCFWKRRNDFGKHCNDPASR